MSYKSDYLGLEHSRPGLPPHRVERRERRGGGGQGGEGAGGWGGGGGQGAGGRGEGLVAAVIIVISWLFVQPVLYFLSFVPPLLCSAGHSAATEP